MATHDNQSKGYLVPDNADPGELNCLLVFYPDDPLYLAALLGSLTYLGTWTAWQRDPAKRGLIAAAAWKEANECTLSSMSCISDLVTVLQEIRDAITNQQLSVNLGDVALDVSPLLPALTGIQSAIEQIDCTCTCSQGGLNDMGITINNCCGCACGCGCRCSGDGGPDVTLPYDPEPLPPPPYVPPPLNPDLANKCGLSHYLIYSLRLSLLRAVDNTGNVSAFRQYLESLLRRAYPIFSGNSLTYEMYVWLMQQVGGNQSLVGQIASLFDAHYNLYVCSLFSSTSTAGASSALADAIDETMDGYTVLKASCLMLAQLLPYSVLFAEAGQYPTPAGFGGRECCGDEFGVIAPIPQPDPESVYELVPIPNGAFTLTPNNNSASLSYVFNTREFTHTPLNTGLNYHEISLALNVEAVLEPGAHVSAHGLVFQPVDRSGVNGVANWKLTVNNSVGGSSALGVEIGTPMLYHQNDITDQSYLDYVAQFTSKVNYGNGPILTATPKAGWRSDTYGTQAQGWGAMRYRAWVIVKKP